MARVVGLTGGIGTGKSTVSRMLARRGAVVVDADAIVHELQAPGAPMLAELTAAFGAGILRADGSLDRGRLGEIVFSDPEARAVLGRITGPPIVAELLRRLDEARGGEAPLVVADIPLLLEGRGPGPYGVDAVVVVYAPEAQQIARQIERDGASADHARQRVRSQMPIDEKRALADHVIDNSGTLAETEAQVTALFRSLTT